MTKEELFAKVLPLAKGRSGDELREVLDIVWNGGLSEGMREARETIMAGLAAPPNGVAQEGEPK